MIVWFLLAHWRIGIFLKRHEYRRTGNQDGIVTVYYGNYTDYVRAKKGLPPLGEDEISSV